jgi:surface antigen
MKAAPFLAICTAYGLLASACTGGGLTLGSAAPAPASSPPPAEGAAVLPTGADLGGILGGPIGAQLDEADRRAAYEAQVAALEAGERRTWRGAHGVFGFVELPPGVSAQGCRAYAQTIYIGGRPQRGHGEGCRQPDGSWRMKS